MIKLTRSFIFVATTAGLASSLSLIGGIGIEHVADKILPLVPLLIAIPGLNDLVGDYASIIAAHSGDPTERKRSKVDLLKAIFKVLGVNIAAIVILSCLTAWTRDYVLTSDFLIRFAIFITVAAVLTVLLMFVVSGMLDVILRKKRVNPDELLIPIITSLADIVMLLFVTLAVLTLFK